MNSSIYPKARKNNLVTTKVNDETVVYDTKTSTASCLNELTTSVWEACDGTSDIPSLLDAVRNAGYQDVTEKVVLMAIDQLNQAGLFENALEIDEKTRKNLNRREMLQLLGARVAVVLPVVSTISIQPAIAAASGGCGGVICSNHNDCCAEAPHCKKIGGNTGICISGGNP